MRLAELASASPEIGIRASSADVCRDCGGYTGAVRVGSYKSVVQRTCGVTSSCWIIGATECLGAFHQVFPCVTTVNIGVYRYLDNNVCY